MRIQEVPRFIRSVAHVPPRQLVRRAYLMLRRRVDDLVGPRLRRASPPAPGLDPHPPLPLFPPREGPARDGGTGLRVSLLAREVSVEPPVEWHPESLDHLRLLHLHYMDYLEGATNAEFERLVVDWIRANPAGGRRAWFAAWNSYAISIRTVVWMQQHAARALRSEPWVGTMTDSIAEQIRFLEKNLETDIGGNHLVKNVKALLWAGRFFDGPEARRWTERARRHLDREISTQILADGMHFERSPSYHLQVLADFLDCYALLPGDELRHRLGDTVDAMATVVARTTHPDGLPSLFSDGALHMAYGPDVCQRVHAALRGATREADGDGPFALEHAGYFGFRQGGDLLLVDCGRIGPDRLPAHAHGDILAFEWSVAGRRVVVDTGVFEYAPGPLRDFCRGTRAHNTVTVAGEDQAELYGAFRVGRRPDVRVDAWIPRDDGFVLTGTHGGFDHLAGRPRHRRTFRLTGGTLSVEDVVENGAGQSVEARLLLHPDCQVTASPGGVEIRVHDRRVTLSTTADVRVEDAPWFPDFGRRVDTRRIVLRYGDAPCTGRFTLRAERA